MTNAPEQLKEYVDLNSKVVAVTGGIGSGKSTFCRFLADLGATVLSADAFAREAVEKNPSTFEAIKSHFGTSILNPDGSLNRKKLGEIVFQSQEQRKQLEQILHPEVKKLYLQALAEVPQDALLVVYDCPLFYEAQLEKEGFRKVIVVKADKEKSIERISKRDALDPNHILSRMNAQLPLCEKARKADIVVENNSSLDELKKKSELVFRQLTSL